MSDDEDQQFELHDDEVEHSPSAQHVPWFLQQPWTVLFGMGVAVVALSAIGRWSLNRYSSEVKVKSSIRR